MNNLKCAFGFHEFDDEAPPYTDEKDSRCLICKKFVARGESGKVFDSRIELIRYWVHSKTWPKE